MSFAIIGKATPQSFGTVKAYQTVEDLGPGSSQTAFGEQALSPNGNALANQSSFTTAVGYGAMESLSPRNYDNLDDINTAIGWRAMRGRQSGSTRVRYNVAIGGETMANAGGGYNIAIGVAAATTRTAGAVTGSGNVMIGTFCPGPTSGNDNLILYNGSTLPQNAVFDVTTQSNRVVIGTTAVTNAYVQVAWTVVSDARDKTDIAPLDRGLAFVQQLKPVTYRFKKTREETDAHGPLRAGFLAQDIVPLEDQPIVIDRDDPDKLRMQSDALVPILVKAIQELTERLERLERAQP